MASTFAVKAPLYQKSFSPDIYKKYHVKWNGDFQITNYIVDNFAKYIVGDLEIAVPFSTIN